MTPSIKWLSVDADAAFLEASQIEINHEPVTPEESDLGRLIIGSKKIGRLRGNLEEI